MENIKLSNVCYNDLFKQHFNLLKYLYKQHKHVSPSSWKNRLGVLSYIAWQVTSTLPLLEWF